MHSHSRKERPSRIKKKGGFQVKVNQNIQFKDDSHSLLVPGANKGLQVSGQRILTAIVAMEIEVRI